MKKIKVVTTGGTIAMSSSQRDEASTLSLDSENFKKLLDLPGVELSFADFSKLPSSNIDSRYARRLVGYLEEETAGVDGIVITHGTDTMEETAFYLEMAAELPVPVVMTGAMYTANKECYDGIVNLRNAVTVCAAEESRNKGTMVVFNQDVFPAVHVEKAQSERPNAFGAVNTGKIGSVRGNEVIYYYDVKKHRKLKNLPSTDYAVLKCHYDIGTMLVEYAYATFKAVVFEGIGSGRIPPGVVEVIADHPETITYLTTRVHSGHLYDEYVYRGSYRDMQSMRVIFSPLNTLKTAILAGLCLGNELGFEDAKELVERFWH